MRWPESWKDPALLDLLKGAAIDALLIPPAEDFAAIRRRAQQDGYEIAAPPGVAIVKGEWPGVRSAHGDASAGPTGTPWVDSNGWAIRLALALNPDAAVWIDAPPPPQAFITADAYLVAIADSAAHGGRWIVTLDNSLAASLAAARPEAQKPWQRLLQTAAFFAAHKAWSTYTPVTNIGVLSDFTGPNEFFSHELLNLLARAGAHARAIPLANASFDGLRVLIYPDAAPPTAALRRRLDAFVKAGGLLMSSEQRKPDDPYLWANDAVVLQSHRYDLVRFWNGGATGSFLAASPDRKHTVAHLLFYSGRAPDSATVRIAGHFRTARAATVDQPALANLKFEARPDYLEAYLPPVSQYVALELE